MKAILILLVTGAVAACGGGRNPDKEALANVPEFQKIGAMKVAIVTGGETLVFDNGAIKGSGSVRSTAPLAKAESASNFSFSGEIAEGGAITLVVNADMYLKNGIEARFHRPVGAATLQVVVTVGSDSLDLSEHFAAVDASQPIAMLMDAHNDHGEAAHVVFWKSGSEEALIEDMLRGRGYGTNWGVRIDNAILRTLARGEPKDKH